MTLLADQHRATNVSHVTTRLDGPAIANWFRYRWPELGVVTIHSLALAQGGGSSSIIIVEHQAEHSTARRSVLRLHPADDPVFPAISSFASSPAMEWAVQQAVLASAPHAALPPLLALEENPAFLGRPFMAMGFVEGEALKPFDYMQRGALASIPAECRRHVFMDLLAQLAIIHAVSQDHGELHRFETRTTGRETLLRHVEAFARDAHRKLAGRSFPALERSFGWLRDNAPEDDRVGICWGDARPGNAILGEGLRPLAVLDWEGAAILPTEADIGWWSLYDEVARTQGPIMDGVPAIDEQLDHYVATSGRTVLNLNYWKVLAAMKTALVLLRTRDRLEANGIATPQQLATRFDNFATRYLEANC